MTDQIKSEKVERFKATYFDECAERLAIAETQLDMMRNVPGRDATDELGELFRSIHSIKGGAGAFGFEDIVTFSHTFEAVLDRLRNRTLTVSGEVLDCLILARDTLAGMISAAQENKVPTDQKWQEIVTELEGFADLKPDDDVGSSRSDPEPVAAGQMQEMYRVEFTPSLMFFETGNDPLPLIRELRTLGKLATKVDISKLPRLSELTPDQAYLAWKFELTTEQSASAIEDVFEFAIDDCDLRINLAEDAAGQVDSDVDTGDVTLPSEIKQPVSAQTSKDEPPAPAAKSTPPTASRQPGVPQLSPTPKIASIRVDLDRVDKLVNMVGELVITQAMLEQYSGASRIEDDDMMLRGIETLSSHMRDLQESVMAIRMQPVKSVFARMPRLVRELSRSLGKTVRLTMIGEETEVDKTVIELLADPLTHMIRNSIDHGIESANARAAAGKSEDAEIVLAASHRSGRIVIEVADDGAGIDRQLVFQKAVDKGLVRPDADLLPDEIDDLIFTAGFSTAHEVSDVSGRGVGMDVVRRSVQDLGGRVTVESAPGQGTRFIMSLPLTLAVMDGMVLRVGNEKYILPTACIVESMRPAPEDLKTLMDRTQVIQFRDEYVPLIHLNKLLGVSGAIIDPCSALVIFAETDSGRIIGILGDELLGQRQVVIKSLEENFFRLEGISAVTILGDGKVALILDVEGLNVLFRSKKIPKTRSGQVSGTEPEVHA